MNQSIACKQWTASKLAGVGDCKLKMWGGSVSHGVCANCLKIGAWKTPEKYQINVVKAKPAPPPQPMPRDQWPIAANVLTQFATDADTGLGDTLARMLRANGVAWVVKQGADILGKNCKCKSRQAWLNAKYPLK